VGARAEHCFASGNLACHDDVRSNLQGRRDIATGELDIELFRQLEQPSQEAIDPGLRQVFWKPKGEEAGQGRSAHGGDVAQATGEASVADHRGWVPVTAEMHVFQAKISRNQQFRAWEEAQDGAIIPNTTHNSLVSRGTSQLPDMLNQVSFFDHVNNL
jgi:hypothetical protein